MEDGTQEKLYEYKFKFASQPYHANLRTKQIVVDIIDVMKLFENWGSKFFGRLPIAFLTHCPWPFEHTAHDLLRIRQQETFVVDQSFGVGGTVARCGGAPQVPFTQV